MSQNKILAVIVGTLFIMGSGYFLINKHQLKTSNPPKGGDIEKVKLLTNQNDWVRVIVTLKGNKFTLPDFKDDVIKKEEVKKIQDDVLKTLSPVDLRLYHLFTYTPAFSGQISKIGFDKLLSNPSVISIDLDKPTPIIR